MGVGDTGLGCGGGGSADTDMAAGPSRGQDARLPLLALITQTSWSGRGARAPYLVHLVHVVLSIPSRPLAWDGVSC